jgi:hypothetical protein
MSRHNKRDTFLQDQARLLDWDTKGLETMSADESRRTYLRRRAEDVAYWRQRAGWFDDDTTMKEYNSGVYDSYFSLDDDSHRSSKSSRGGGGRKFSLRANVGVVQNVIKVVSGIVAIALAILIFRVIMRKVGEGKKDKKKQLSSSNTRSGSRSRSRTRSRSRSRKDGGDDYNRMDDDDAAHSKRSTRSSRSKSRSKSRGKRSGSRSRSKTRERSGEDLGRENTEAVLV